MENRYELNEDDLDQVIGGAFNYYTNPDDTMYCVVDGAGTYNCTENAKDKISAYIVTHRGCTLQEVIDYALNKGYFW